MALANFIDQVATSASQLLGGFQPSEFLSRLEEQVIGIGFDAEALASPEGSATLDLLVRLLARLYPRICLTRSDGDNHRADAELTALAIAINPHIDLVEEVERATCAVVVGSTSAGFACQTFYVGSDGWRARLSDAGPVDFGHSGNPVGAGAAACFGAANIFRTVFRDQLPQGAPDREIDLSLLTFADPRSDDPVITDAVDLGQTHLVGAGAIGNGFVWAMSRWRGLTGSLHVIDPEDVDLGNLQRYVMCDQDAVDQPKVNVAATDLQASALAVTARRESWATYVANCDDRRFARLAVALDTARDRIAVQASIPEWICNAWTQETDLGVSRHRFGEGACLACLYLPAGRTKDQDELVAEELGMPDAKLEIRTLLQRGTPVDAGFVTRAATALGVPFEPLAQFVGQPLISFYQGAVCGGLVMRLTGGASKVKVVVPMSFQSALAGIMLAAETMKHAAGAPPGPATSTRIDLLRPLGAYLHDPKARDRSGRCLCADTDFLEAYRDK